MTFLALHKDLSAVPVNDAVGHAHPKAGAPRPLGGEEWIEDPVADFLGHPKPGVADRDFDLRCGDHARPDAKATAVRHGVQRVEHDIDQHLPKLGWVADNRWD